MLLFGLTGGIASGKSTVAQYFVQLGCPVIDADRIAKDGKLSYVFTRNRVKWGTLEHRP